LGNNAWNGPGTTGGDNQVTPARVALDETVVDFSVGNEHTCATTTSNTYCWGRSDQRQLGDGRTVPHETDIPSRPAPVSSIVGAVGVNVGYGDSCFVRHDGTVRCAGFDTWGEIAPAGGAYPPLLCPAYERDDLVQVATSINYGCRVSMGGELSCTSRYSTSVQGPGALDARQVAVGNEAACVVRADASVACMGRNRAGQLGVDLNPESSSLLYPVPNLTQVQEVAAGNLHFCARTDHEVFCWGDGRFGQLGSVRVDRAPTPRRVLDLPERAADIDAHGYTSCAVLVSGDVYCWGTDSWVTVAHPHLPPR
jgi:alpha-tubulin suppressor-like RCC1 family protein